jgi:hypothetical protein
MRVSIGSGSQKGKQIRTLTPNHIQIFWTLKKIGKPMTCRELQKILYSGMSNGQPLLYEGRTGKHPWSYHILQKTISLLVGRHLVSMTSPNYTGFNWELNDWVVSPTPLYFLSVSQCEEWSRLLQQQKGITVG